MDDISGWDGAGRCRDCAKDAVPRQPKAPDEFGMLDRLVAAQERMREAMMVIDDIARKLHRRAGAYEAMDRERLRQQTRANDMAIEIERLTDQSTRELK
jgi:hypothetical protein